MRLTLPITLAAIFFFGQTTIAQTKVRQSRTELKNGNSTSSSKGNSSSSSSSNSDGCGFFAAFGDIIWQTLGVVLIGDAKQEEHLHNPMSKYPYQNKNTGNYVSDDTTPIKPEFRFDVRNDYLFSSSNLQGNHFKATIRPCEYFYLQGGYVRLFEYNHTTHANDQLTLVNANFCYDRFRFNKFNLGWSIGMTYIGNNVKKAGLNLGFSTDIFIAKPISLSGSSQWSTINDQSINQINIRANYHVKRWQFSLGYERYQIATPEFNFISGGVGISL